MNIEIWSTKGDPHRLWKDVRIKNNFRNDKSLGIKLCFSSPFYHNTNGIVKRQLRTIREYINTSLKERKKTDWAKILPEIEFTMNATIQKSIGWSPAEVIYGRKICGEQWYADPKPQRIEMSKDEKKAKETPTKRSFHLEEEVLVNVETRSKDKDR